MNSVLDFLIPANEPLQMFFFCVIAGSAFLSTLFVFLQTRVVKSSWERRWNRNSEKYQLDLQNSSVSELYNIVETLSEKIAGIMPGMLLIVGLLGTFIGLGIALDKASIILQTTPDNTMDVMDSSMNELMKMMQGLGTKFKTSTWGIISFITLKFLDIVIGYEYRRLNWCINKFKSETEKLKESQLKEKNETREFWTNILSNATRDISHSIDDQSTQLVQSNYFLSNQLLGDFEKIHSWNELFSKKYDSNNDKSSNLLGYIMQEIKNSSDNSSKTVNEKINLLINEMSETINSNNNKLISYHENATNNSLQNVERFIETSASSLSASVHKDLHQLDTNITNQLASVNDNTVTYFNSIISNQDNVKVKLIAMVDASKDTNRLMNSFTTSVADNITSLQSAVSGMSEASLGINQSANNLKTVIDSLNHEIEAVLQNVDQNLNNTINVMSDDFRKNISTMAVQLEAATTQISTSITDMSTIINTTMNAVDDNMKQSTGTQKKVLEDFQLSSSTLNENVETMINLVNKLSNDITSGLKAVSENGQRMLSLDKRYNGIQDNLDIFMQNIASHLIENNDKTYEQINSFVSKISNENSLFLKELIEKNHINEKYFTDFIAKLDENNSILHTNNLNDRENLKNIDSTVNKLVDISKDYISNLSKPITGIYTDLNNILLNLKDLDSKVIKFLASNTREIRNEK